MEQARPNIFAKLVGEVSGWKWRQKLPPRFVLLRVGYDIVGSALALALAFFVRLLLIVYERQNVALFYELGEEFLRSFYLYAPTFIVVSVCCLYFLGLYKEPKVENRYAWKPFKIILAVSLIPIIWSAILYYFAMPEANVPRGASLISWILLLIIVGGPRIAKFYFLQNVSIDFHQKQRSSHL